jgi:NIMA (never in mitosis gene a)-related kinase 1/4/5
MNEYQIIKTIGKGSFGEVFLVKHVVEKRLYCLKKIKLSSLKSQKERDGARSEVSLMRKLNHPFIINFKDAFIIEDIQVLCILMTYASCGDLNQLRNGMKPFSVNEDLILNWFLQITLAVDYLHRHNILHRDIKLSNVFVLGTGRLVLADLGISKFLEGKTLASTQIGTPYYMAPEVFLGEAYGSSSDIWGLGCLLYELATGFHPFDGKNLSALSSAVRNGITKPIPGKFSRNLQDLINSMLQVDPVKRITCETILRLPFLQRHLDSVVNECAKDSIPLGNSPNIRDRSGSAQQTKFESSLISQSQIVVFQKQLNQLNLRYEIVNSGRKIESQRSPAKANGAELGTDRAKPKILIGNLSSSEKSDSPTKPQRSHRINSGSPNQRMKSFGNANELDQAFQIKPAIKNMSNYSNAKVISPKSRVSDTPIPDEIVLSTCTLESIAGISSSHLDSKRSSIECIQHQNEEDDLENDIKEFKLFTELTR